MGPAAWGPAGPDPVGLLHERQPLLDGRPEVGIASSSSWEFGRKRRFRQQVVRAPNEGRWSGQLSRVDVCIETRSSPLKR